MAETTSLSSTPLLKPKLLTSSSNSNEKLEHIRWRAITNPQALQEI